MHLSPQIWEENGGVSYSPKVAYLAHCGGGSQWWSRVTGGRSRVTTAGSQQWQEWGDAGGPGLGGVGVLGVWSKGGRSGVPSAAYYSAREEGTGSSGTLGEESLRRHTCLHHVTGVSPININIGKFHCRVICQCGPAAVVQLPSCLDRLGWWEL